MASNYVTLIGTVTLLNALAAMSPGPDFVMVVKNSLSYSRRTGIFTGIGIGLGIGIHIFYCAAGIGYIISKSATVFTILKFAGAGYLIYMGIKSILAKGSHLDISEQKKMQDLSRLQALKIGFLTNVLNPKATLFFLGLFSLVVKPDTPYYILGIQALIMILTAMGWFMIVALFFTQKAVQNAFLRFEKILNKVLGGLLVALGIKIATMLR